MPNRSIPGNAPGHHLELTPLSSMTPKSFEPLVKGLLFKDSRAAIYGGPATGKGFLALGLAMCVATGRQWHGLEGFWPDMPE